MREITQEAVSAWDNGSLGFIEVVYQWL